VANYLANQIGYFPTYYASSSTSTWTTTWNAWNYTSTGTTWGNWTTTAATTNFPQVVWNQWVNDVLRDPYQFHQQTEAEEEAQRVRNAQLEERAAKHRADAAQAVERAETLLHENLRPGQRRMLRERRRFYVRSQRGRRYEIERGHHANVWEVDGSGKRLNRLCVYPTGGLPEADCMLGQKLHLEYDEDRFRQVAHITPVVA